jgi:hypothetical protein
MEERHERDQGVEARPFRQPPIEPRELDDLDLEKIMVVFVHRCASCPQRPMLTDDLFADLELAGKPKLFHVAVRLSRVEAEQRVLPQSPFVRSLWEVLHRDERPVRPWKPADDPPVVDLIGHGSGPIAIRRLPA